MTCLISLLVNQRPVSRSHDHTQLIRGQYLAPRPHLSVVEDKEADGEAGQRAAEVTHEARPVLRVVEAHPDGEHHVVDGEQEDEGDSDDFGDGPLYHLLDPEVAVLLPV